MIAPIRVHYYRVHDPSYPRNRRIRRFLASLDGVTVTMWRPSARRHRLARHLQDLVRLVRDARRSDILVLSEMRLAHAAVVRLVGGLTRTPIVVDGFIGLHETRVGDWKELSERSLRARLLRLLDAIAVRAADLYLTDTEVRADIVRERFPNARVISLPVGAPPWAQPRAAESADVLRILYYGNYIPLHGLDLVVEALAMLPAELSFRLTLIGDGGTRRSIEQQIDEAGIGPSCTFRPAVPESELAEYIAAADVVLGVFGPSAKARSVIANKVWQGLACGRTTVTQHSDAIEEIADTAGPQLMLTEPGSPRSIADALERCAAVGAPATSRTANDLHVRLERLVQLRFELFATQLRTLVQGRP